MKTFPELKKGRWGKINLNQESKKVEIDFTNTKVCQKWIDKLHKEKNIKYSSGGFLEDRSNLWKEHYNKSKKLFIHLGTDYIVPAGTKVALTENAVLRGIIYDYSWGGWGKMVLFSLRNDSLYLLYGHLKKLPKLKIGQKYKADKIIGVVGKPKENGGWFPHLHVQLMTKKFLILNKNDYSKIDGYATKYSKLLKEVLNPEKIIS